MRVLISLVEVVLHLCPRCRQQCRAESHGVLNADLERLVHDVEHVGAGRVALRADVTAPAEGRDGDYVGVVGKGDVAGKATIEAPLCIGGERRG